MNETDAQIARLIAERNLLLSAIALEDYAKIQAQLVAISESPDSTAPNSAHPVTADRFAR